MGLAYGDAYYTLRGHVRVDEGNAGGCDLSLHALSEQGGSLFSFNLFVSEADNEQEAKTLVYEDPGDNGYPSYRHFCGSLRLVRHHEGCDDTGSDDREGGHVRQSRRIVTASSRHLYRWRDRMAGTC